MQIDIRVMEHLCSKICHDLVSPVSAINNGVELIEDIGGSVVDEAMKLIGDSAGLAARRLKLFRMAYGRAGSEESLGVKDVRQVAAHYMGSGKVTLTWPEDQPGASLAAHRGFVKVMLNLVVLSEELLPYGGILTLRSAMDGDNAGCRFEIVGRAAQLTPQIQAAFEGTASIDDITPRTVQAYVTNKFATHFELKMRHDQSIPDRLDITLLRIKAALSV